MTNWEKQKEHLINFGILPVDKVPNNVLDYLKNNYDTNNPHNAHLAGQIKKEYEFKTWPRYIDDFILKQTLQPVMQKHTRNISVMSSNKPYYLKRTLDSLMEVIEHNDKICVLEQSNKSDLISLLCVNNCSVVTLPTPRPIPVRVPSI